MQHVLSLILNTYFVCNMYTEVIHISVKLNSVYQANKLRCLYLGIEYSQRTLARRLPLPVQKTPILQIHDVRLLFGGGTLAISLLLSLLLVFTNTPAV